MASYKFDHVCGTSGWFSPGYVTVEDDGTIAAVGGTPPEGGFEDIGGIAVPGIANLHSHAFQRAMAGLSEFRTDAAEDSFWTWRDLMYRFVDRITPDDLEAIAAQLYLEMLKSGYTAVGEFQYLHHDRDGAAFANRAEMTLRTLAAAEEAGIGATFLPVLYQYSGFGAQTPGEGQRRFINDVDGFLEIYETLAAETDGKADFHVGVAPHSLRAAGEDAIRSVVDAIHPAAPIHIHIAEQEKEVADCEAWSGMRPVEFLMDRLPVDRRWCLVHATHMTAAETEAAAKSGAVAGLCPTTEANLGDGLFDLPDWLTNGGALGIGSDSHVSISPVEELRLLEYGQRLRDRRRNIVATADISTGRRLLDLAVSGGAQALGRTGTSGEVGICTGARADMAVLDSSAVIFAGQSTETYLESWIFSGNVSVVTDVFVGGKRVVSNGVHEREDKIAARYRKVVSTLMNDG